MRLKIVGRIGGTSIESFGSDRSKPRKVLIAADNDVQIIDLDTGNQLAGVRGFSLSAEANDLVRVQLDLYPSEVQLDVEGAILEPEDTDLELSDDE